MIELRFEDGPLKGQCLARPIAQWEERFPIEDAQHGPCEDVYRRRQYGYTVAFYRYLGCRRRVRGESKWVTGGP